VRPVYLCDYPIVENDAVCALIGEWLAEGSADIGTHLHPWVNPPHAEDVCVRNSFAGNLPPALERAKLTMLTDRIAERFGQRPVAYRAGRYGIGRNTAQMLIDLGYRLDCSVRSRFDFSAQEGPDFVGFPVQPWWVDAAHRLAEMPLSSAYVGLMRGLGDRLDRVARRAPILGSGLSRLGMLERIPLTPEGVGAHECIRAIDALLDDGLAILSFSFHSPSVEPGHTLYVRTQADVEQFYRWWDTVLAHLDRRGVKPFGLDGLFARLQMPPTSDETCQAA